MNTLEPLQTTPEIAVLIELLRVKMHKEYGGDYSFGIFAHGKVLAAHSKDYGDVAATPFIHPQS